MRIKVIYDDISGEELEALIKNQKVVKVEVISGKGNIYEDLDKAIKQWLKEHNINGYAVAYACDLFRGSTLGSKFPELSSKRFAKAVRNTGAYTAKNMRIGDVIQYAFVAIDGRNL